MWWQRSSFFETAHHTTSAMDTKLSGVFSGNFVRLQGLQETPRSNDWIDSELKLTRNLHKGVKQAKRSIKDKLVIRAFQHKCFTAVFRSCQRSACRRDPYTPRIRHTSMTSPICLCIEIDIPICIRTQILSKKTSQILAP